MRRPVHRARRHDRRRQGRWRLQRGHQFLRLPAARARRRRVDDLRGLNRTHRRACGPGDDRGTFMALASRAP
ncbi:hypothetical protein LUTEI9C_20023 [Luteimonas sp. 9C]|nr:hypothetical protein LUTEI9C_20023 [Luteimonas sp. 9C]